MTSPCDYPNCKAIGGYDAEVCSEENEDETFDVNFCKQHYIDLCVYNGNNPEDEGIELTADERKIVYEKLGIEE